MRKIRVVVEIVDAEKVVNLPKEVPLTRNFEQGSAKFIGEARVEKQDGKLWADLVFYLPPPLQLDGYPCIGGRVIKRKDGVIEEVELTEVSICASPNADLNVKKISEQQHFL